MARQQTAVVEAIVSPAVASRHVVAPATAPTRDMRRRVASLWLPRLAAERHLRRMGTLDLALAVVDEQRGTLRLTSLSAPASAAGLACGMGLADACAICPDLLTRTADPAVDGAFLASLRRWAMRFSPWAAAEGEEGLVLDITGCAHLFGGEAAMLAEMQGRLAATGLTARLACADTRGAAWALARHGHAAPPAAQARNRRLDRALTAGPDDGAGASGGTSPNLRPDGHTAPQRPPVADAIAIDAPATRVRTPARGHRAPMPGDSAPVIAAPGQTRDAIAGLPVAALRLAPDAAAGLTRLGLRTIGDLVALPRAGLARRFGIATVRRLDQVLGAEPEPVAVAGAEPVRAVRLSLPEPLGRMDDLTAALARLLDRLTQHLADQGHGARRLRLTLRRVDGGTVTLPIGLARPSRDPALIARLFERSLGEVDAGFGIDALRLEAVETDPLTPQQHRGHLDAAAQARPGGEGEALATLLGKLGNRLGFERLERYLPADSHIPARAFTVASAAFTEAPAAWPAPSRPRPLLIFPPEPVHIDAPGPLPRRAPPLVFRWRARTHRVIHATGPERIAPEWWLDDPAWRSGVRDYWRVQTERGQRLWLFFTPQSPDWWVEGEFA